jgi:hypothetical protein
MHPRDVDRADLARLVAKHRGLELRDQRDHVDGRERDETLLAHVAARDDAPDDERSCDGRPGEETLHRPGARENHGASQHEGDEPDEQGHVVRHEHDERRDVVQQRRRLQEQADDLGRVAGLTPAFAADVLNIPK